VITVTKIEVVAAPQKLPEVTDTAYEPPKPGETTDPTPPKNLIPAKYGNPTTTDLFAVVEEDENSEITLELND
jgi:hypothetical protein